MSDVSAFGRTGVFDQRDLLAVALAVCMSACSAICLSACGSDCDDGSSVGSDPMYAVLSAFPAELAPLVERADIDETIPLDGGRTLRVGRLGGVRVVLALAGIGLLNAEAMTRLVLERYDVAGVVVSGVAGSPLRIGDVAVPIEWRFPDGPTYEPRPQWLALARTIAASGIVLEHCTVQPNRPSAGEICMPFEPAIVVGGTGQSSDPFGNNPSRCTPGGGDVFGCDIPPSGAFRDTGVFDAHGLAEPTDPAAVDMETAAIAREATAHGVPFIAFRAVSDGAEDPLMLPGFPAQFFAYYRLAGENAAIATIAFLERVQPR
jgi:nucleoside phosphorylase